MSLPSATNARILEEISKLAGAIHNIELQLAKRIPAEALAETHLTVQLLKQQMLAMEASEQRKETRIEALEAQVKKLAEGASDNSTKWGMTAKVATAVLSLLAGVIGAAIGKLWK